MHSLYPTPRYLDASSTLQLRRVLDARLDAASTARRQGSGVHVDERGQKWAKNELTGAILGVKCDVGGVIVSGREIMWGVRTFPKIMRQHSRILAAA